MLYINEEKDFIIKNKLIEINDIINVKVYIGSTNTHYIIKPAIANKIYDKGKYIMILCQLKTSKNIIYNTCVTQYKSNLALYY